MAPAPLLVAVAPPNLTPDGGGRAYRSLLAPARVSRALLTLAAHVSAMVAGVYVARLVIGIDAVAEAAEITTKSIDGLADLSELAAVAALVILGVAVVAFAAWTTAAYRNLPSLRVGDRRMWTGWTVAGWLLPGPNLVVPKMVVDDLWRASKPDMPPHNAGGWHRDSVGDVVHRWWAMWLAVPAVLLLAYSTLADRVTALDEQQLLAASCALAGLLLVGALMSAREIVGIITVAQARRAEIVAGELARAQARSTAAEISAATDLRAYLSDAG